MAENDVTRIPVTRATRDDVIKPLKRGDETYDDVIRRLASDGGGGPTVTIDADDIFTDDVLDRLASSVAEAADLEIGIDGEAVAELIAARVDANQLDGDALLEAIRTDVRTEVRDAIHGAMEGRR